MPFASQAAPVQAATEVIWELLLDKIEHPEKFVPGVSAVEILEKGDGQVLRRMTVSKASGEETVTERITWDPEQRQVVFTLVDHPSYEGSVTNRVGMDEGGNPVLDFSMEWRWTGAGEEPEEQVQALTNATREAVSRTRELAEQAR